MLHKLKHYLRIDGSEDDDMLTFLMQAAKEYLNNSGIKESDANLPLYRLAVMLYVALHYENRDPSLKIDRFNFAFKSILLQLKSDQSYHEPD